MKEKNKYPVFMGQKVTKEWMKKYTQPNGEIDFDELERRGITEAFKAVMDASLTLARGRK